MKIQNVHDEAFRPYGKVITTVDCTSLCEAMMNTECPADHTIDVASDPEIEKVDSFAAFRDQVYGGMPIQIGYCNGSNHKLNGLEYHRDSEVNVAVNDLILLLGKEQDIDPETFAYDSSKVEAFLVPAGTCIEVYATTLHFAPCNASEPFRCVVVLPRGTNTELAFKPDPAGESRLLTHTNKWLLAHAEAPEAKNGAVVALKGENPVVNY